MGEFGSKSEEEVIKPLQEDEVIPKEGADGSNGNYEHELTHQHQDKDQTRSEDETDNMMYAMDPRAGQPVIYAYAGPPSIQLATWSDRSTSARSSRARSAHTQESHARCH